MTTYGVNPARLAKCIELVDEDDARGLLACLFEEIAHARGAHSDKHLHELRAVDGEKRHACLAGDGTRKQGFTGPRWTYQQHPLRDAPAEMPIALRLFEETDNFLQLLFRFIHTRDIVKGYPGRLFHVDLDLALADLHEPAGRAHALHEKAPQRDEDDRRQDPGEQRCEPSVLNPPGKAHLCRFQFLDEIGIVHTHGPETVHTLAELAQLVELLLGEKAFQAFVPKSPRNGSLCEDYVFELARL